MEYDNKIYKFKRKVIDACARYVIGKSIKDEDINLISPPYTIYY